MHRELIRFRRKCLQSKARRRAGYHAGRCRSDDWRETRRLLVLDCSSGIHDLGIRAVRYDNRTFGWGRGIDGGLRER
jgi:hypothetical protein